MIYMGFNNALIKWKRVIIDALGMAAIMIIMVLVISSYYKESEMYTPYRKLLSSKGVEFFSPYPPFAFDEEGVYDMGMLWEELTDVDEIYFSLMESVYLNGTDISQILGLDYMMAQYEPEMAEGVWITEAKNTDYLNVVVTENRFDVKCGDLIDLVEYEDGSAISIVQAYVCGIIKNGTHIYLGNKSTTPTTTTALHSVYDSSTNAADASSVYIYMFKEELSNNFKKSASCNSIFIKYNDKITPKDEEKNNSYLNGLGITHEFQEIRDNSISVIKKSLMSIIPLFIGVVFFVSVSFAVTSAIGTMNELELYAILFLSGMKRKGIVIIKLVESILTVICGICIFVIASNYITGSKLKNVFEYEFYPIELVMIAVIVIYLLTIRILIPTVFMRKKSCTDILREVKL